MEDHNTIRVQIDRTNHYNDLIKLREKIWSLSGKYPFSIYVNLRGRIEEKIRTFDNPMCDQAVIRIHFGNKSQKEMEPSECQNALDEGLKLSEYIFAQYKDAEDYEILPSDFLGSYNKDVIEKDAIKEFLGNGFKGSGPNDDHKRIEVLQDRVEYLIRLIDHMNRVYSDTIPKIASDLEDINRKFEELYSKLVGSNLI